MRTKTLLITAVAAVGAGYSPAQAGSAQTTMAVTSLTVNSCAIAASALAFGTLNQISGSATDSQTTVVVSCTPGITYNVGMDMGAHANGGQRRMEATLGGSDIPYLLYTDAARTSAWGNTVGTNTVSGTATATPATLTVYGRVPSNAPLVPAGGYSDVVTVTVTF